MEFAYSLVKSGYTLEEVKEKALICLQLHPEYDAEEEDLEELIEWRLPPKIINFGRAALKTWDEIEQKSDTAKRLHRRGIETALAVR